LNILSILKGSIDYLIRSSTELIVIEAKNADIDRGFTQLSVELITIDALMDIKDSKLLYGVVTMGDLWRFGVLDRTCKTIKKDMNAFFIPTDLEALFSIFVGILDP
jgi:hypothetical protein